MARYGYSPEQILVRREALRERQEQAARAAEDAIKAEEIQAEIARRQEEAYNDFMSKNGLGVNTEFFYFGREEGKENVLTSEKCPLLKIINDIEEHFSMHLAYSPDYILSEKERRNRLREIYYYMSDYNILDDIASYLPFLNSGDKVPIGKFVSDLFVDESRRQKPISERMQEMGQVIEECDGIELIMLDAFFTNRLAKILEDTKKEYGNNNIRMLYEQLKMDGRVKQFDKKTLEEWYEKNLDNRGVTEDDFIAYVKMEELKSNIYAEKNKSILEAYAKEPEKGEWYIDKLSKDGNTPAFKIQLDGYAYPIALHVGRDAVPQELKGHLETRETKMLTFWPFRFTEMERMQLDRKFRKFKQAAKADKTKGETAENQPEVTEVRAEVPDTEVRKTDDNSQQPRRTRAKYRSDDEVISSIEKTLVDAGIIEGFTDNQRGAMLDKNKSDNVKFDSKLSAMKSFLKEYGVPEDEVELEAAKMFTYVKITQRGFSYTLRKQQEVAYLRRQKELELYGKDFFGSINAGFDAKDLETIMSIEAGDPKCREIRGARTLNQPFKEEFPDKQSGDVHEQNSETVIKPEPEVVAEPELAEEIVDEPEPEHEPELVEEPEQEQGEEPEPESETVAELEPAEEIELEPEPEELPKGNTVEEELALMRTEQGALKQKEAEIIARKAVLEAELQQILNDIDDENLELLDRRKRIMAFLNPEYRGFITQELAIDSNKILQLQQKLPEVEARLKEKADIKQAKADEKRKQIAEADAELAENKSKQAGIAQSVEDEIDDLLK